MAEQPVNQNLGLVGTLIVVDESPLIFWDRGDPHRQLDFLESIDPSFFVYLARIHQPQLEGDDSLWAAVGLRVAYSHALECLFACIGAALQAPDCPAGWLLKYKNSDLKSLVAKISGRKSFHNKLSLGVAGWPDVANALLPSSPTDDQSIELRQASAILWDSLARDLVDDNLDDEYNSLKHGFRVQSGEWQLRIGAEVAPGTPPPPERMRVMASSPFGSTFLRAVPLHRYQWGFEKQRVNWDPIVLAGRLPLVSSSIFNVLSFLKFANAFPKEELRVRVFDQESVSQALTEPDHSSSFRFRVRSGIRAEELSPLSREDILNYYRQSSEPYSRSRKEAGP